LALAIGPHYWYYHLMTKRSTKKTVVPKKRRGRLFTGVDNRDPVTAIRLSPEFRASIDAWAAQQDDKPPRSEAIRRLVERGLAPAMGLPAELLQIIDAWAASKKLTRSEAIRALIDEGIVATVPHLKFMPAETMTASRGKSHGRRS
jgi:hypothetical protein